MRCENWLNSGTERPSLDEPIGTILHGLWYHPAKFGGCTDIDHQLEFCRLLDRQISWLCTLRLVATVRHCGIPTGPMGRADQD